MNRRLAMLVSAAAVTAVLAAVPSADAASSPTVATGSTSHVADTSAVLGGRLNPNGRRTTYYFQWGLTTAYGATSAAHSAGRGTRAVSVKTTAAALLPGTVYHYRLVAANAAGLAVGSDRAFKTHGNPPPGVSTGPPSQVGRNSVTLTAVINPSNQATSWFIQYGRSSYTLETIPAALPGGGVPVTVSATLQGLEARSIFHYRIVALHSDTPPQPGADATFMTLPRERPLPRVRARTSPARTRGHQPFVFTTSGSVKGPNWIPGAFDCNGQAVIRFLLGRRQVGFTLAPVQPDCRFAGQTVLGHLPPHRPPHPPLKLTVLVDFSGNAYLRSGRPAAGTVTVS